MAQPTCAGVLDAVAPLSCRCFASLPGLENRGIAYAPLALGLAGMLIELLSATFAPRLVLFLTVLAIGAIVLVRCRRTERRQHAALLVTAISCGSPSPGGVGQ